MNTLELSSKSIAELEQLISTYPWFSYARRELFLKLSAKGDEYRKEALKKALFYLYPDRRVFREAYVLSNRIQEGSGEQIYELNYKLTDENINAEKAAPAENEQIKREVVIIGGDYFSKEDFRELQKEENVPFIGLDLSEDLLSDTVENDAAEFKDENFYTETLAKIYAEQELYDRAYEVYDKLILLYPEKSVYFATLKDEIKKHL